LTSADAYNPDSISGGIAQNNAQAPSVIDGNPSTGWTTDQYYSGQLQKQGVGIWVQTSGVAAQSLSVVTATPGWSATIYGTNTQPDAYSFANSHWVSLGSTASVGATQRFDLTDRTGARNRTAYAYYLVWITKLPPNSQYVKVNEIKLFAPHG
jgi:hypothetical protein